MDNEEVILTQEGYDKIEETLEELKLRASTFLQWIKNEYPNKVVLVVGHGIINKAVQSVFYGRPMNEINVMKNADVRILHIE